MLKCSRKYFHSHEYTIHEQEYIQYLVSKVKHVTYPESTGLGISRRC